MYKVSYNNRIGEVVAEYERDGVFYVTIVFEDVETNWIPLDDIQIISE